MFHYRLAPSNNRSRMLVAVLLALALHMGLMNFEFTPELTSVPEVSLPRSVSVFLGQKKTAEKPEQQTLEAQTEKSFIADQTAETDQESHVPPETSGVQKKRDNTLPHPVISEKKVKKAVEITEVKRALAVEEILPADIKTENITEEIKTQSSAAAIQKTSTPAKPQPVQEKDGVIQPGTLQMAYPRYQLNAPPTYPGLARKRGQEGTVILQVLVNREGRVENLKMDTSSNFSLLDRAAIKAVRKWSFEAGRQGEERIPMWVRVPVTFKLKK